MKLVRTMMAAVLLLGMLGFGASGPARATVDMGSEDALGGETVTSGGSVPALSKAGVIAAVGCGMAVASFILLPNPFSAGIASFDCTLMMLDALDSPDR